MTTPILPEGAQANLTVFLGQLVENYRNCQVLGRGAAIAGVLKANAYGLGMEPVGQALFHQAGCRVFFVANLFEALDLRRILPEATIYVLDGLLPGHERWFMDHTIRPVLNDLDQIRRWAKLEQGTTPNLACAIHFDTGMNRLGLSSAETEAFVADWPLRDQLNIALVMSHLACADQPDSPHNQAQLDNFHALARHFPDVPKSLANSGGLLLGPDYHFDLVRPGLLLYGGQPNPQNPASTIRMPFQITGKILQMRTVAAGQHVGYGADWTAAAPTRIALVNIGYGDGYLQRFNNCGLVWVRDRECPVIGRVSMDILAIDVSGVAPGLLCVGDDVELLGPHITLEMAAEISSLSAYEILTGIGTRYQRLYVETGQQNHSDTE